MNLLLFSGDVRSPALNLSRNHLDLQSSKHMADTVEHAGGGRASEMEADHLLLHVKHGRTAVAAGRVPSAQDLIAEPHSAPTASGSLVPQARAVVNVLDDPDRVIGRPASLLNLHVPLHGLADALRHTDDPDGRGDVLCGLHLGDGCV